MKDLIVICSCTREQGFLPEYRRQLDAAGIDLHVEHLHEMPNGCGNLELKIRTMRSLTRLFQEYEKIVFSDAWDVLFYGTKQDVLAKTPDLIMAAERNCWPDGYLAPHFPGDSPWRFVNGGLMAGSPYAILEWLEAVESHPFYHPQFVDQQFFNFLRLHNSPLVTLDDTTELFYCMQQEKGELNFQHGVPFNTLCGTRPSFIHFNGKWDATNFLMRHQLSLQTVPSTGTKELQNDELQHQHGRLDGSSAKYE